MALERIDLIVADTALSPIGGIELCVRLRSQMIDVPIVFVSKDADLEDRIDALLAGGDAFLVHPVHVNELVARVRRILWRVEIAEGQRARVGDLSLDDTRGEALDNGIPIELSITEYRLLRYLLVNRGQTVSRSQILQSIWGTERCSPKLVDVYVGYLREAPGLGGHPQRAVARVRARTVTTLNDAPPALADLPRLCQSALANASQAAS